MCVVHAAGGVVLLTEPFPGVLLIAHDTPAELRLPKGRIEPGETREEAARRETFEETGVSGDVGHWVGAASWEYLYDGQQITKIVDYFLIDSPRWTDCDLDSDVRGIVVASPCLALELLTFPAERGILAKALEMTKKELQMLHLGTVGDIDDRSGGKALGLARLMARGFAVPPAFVVVPDEPLDQDATWDFVRTWVRESVDESGSANLAVRSSSLVEDSLTASHAGEFKSVLGRFKPDGLIRAITEVRESATDGTALPVIVQLAINPVLSGVAFSCDPVTFERGSYTLSWVEGVGSSLVSGEDAGSTIVVRSADEALCSWPHGPHTARQLILALAEIEEDLGMPADIEWAIDSAGKLWLLQARPVVLPQGQCADARSESDLAALPGVIAGHPKIKLRSAAARRGVVMSNAAVLIRPHGQVAPQLPEWIPSPDAAGLSIVLLHPAHITGKVQREFAQVSGMNVPFFAQGCRRYSIRRYPSHQSAGYVAGELLGRGLEESWLAGVVLQEIYDAEATGIVRRLGDDFIVELAVGHFVPKGVVDPSRLIISTNGEVTESHRIPQETAYRFVNGHVVTEHPVEQQLMLSDDQIAAAIMQISPLFSEYPDDALEFGIIKDRGGDVSGYVIDVAEGDSKAQASQLSKGLIGSGVLSPGRATGRVIRTDNNAYDQLDTHLLERFEHSDQQIEDAIIVAPRASVDLLPLVSRCGQRTAFVFRHASLLAHLCVILRERGIAAVTVTDDRLFDCLTDDVLVTVEASDPDWAGTRVIMETAR
jgi:8-oxo-dGTP pyrophosphatase MutT (NUDIX family)